MSIKKRILGMVLVVFLAGMSCIGCTDQLENIIRLKDFVPFFQTISWIVFGSIILIVFRGSLNTLINTLLDRVKKGSSLKARPFEIGEDLSSLQSVVEMSNKIKIGSICRIFLWSYVGK